MAALPLTPAGVETGMWAIRTRTLLRRSLGALGLYSKIRRSGDRIPSASHNCDGSELARLKL